MEGWRKILLYAGGAAATAAVLYYLLREDTDVKPVITPGDDPDKKKKVNIREVTKEQVIEILNEILASQTSMKNHIKGLTKAIQDEKLDFDQTYRRVREVQPDDVLEKRGISPMELDQLLAQYQSDPAVREGIARVMAPPSGSKEAGKEMPSAARVVEVHGLMLRTFEELVKSFSAKPNKGAYDVKTVMVAAQVIVGAKVEEKFSLTSEDIELAVMAHNQELERNQEFMQVNQQMQMTVHKLMSGVEGAVLGAA